MACFSDLPFELQTDIWTLVLPHRGGVHWIEIEGFPHPSHIIKKSLEWTDDLYNNKEPDERKHTATVDRNDEFQKYCYDLNKSIFFQHLYATVPSVYGKSRGQGLLEDIPTQDVLDEITATQRCRQLSTYTQVTTLLITCQTSRLAALDYLRKMISDAAWPVYRGAGPMYRTRPLNTWKQQYQHIEAVPEGHDRLIPTICGTLDLAVFRLHTATGYPKEILTHAHYQLRPGLGGPVIPSFDRIGIEWHSLWATPEGRKELRERAIYDVISLTDSPWAQLYWLVDGVPRPQWDQYPSAIPIAFSRVIERRSDRLLGSWSMEKAWKDRLLKHHNLHQEFEANGRRYYVVFVLAEWTCDYFLEESFRDPAVSWDGPFPGGEALWPKALRDPVRVASEIQQSHLIYNLRTDPFCSYVLSWEPI